MDIEDEIFKRYKINYRKLLNYGFLKKQDKYVYSLNILDGSFKVDIEIFEDAKVKGKIYDLASDSEYTNFRVQNVTGKFANTVLSEYIKVLEDIRKKCYEKEYFVSNQANRIARLAFGKFR